MEKAKRQTIQGEVLGTKWVEFHLGYGKKTSTLKMLVQVNESSPACLGVDGFKVWVTVPNAIADGDGVRGKIVDRGDIIQFEVALKCTNDPKFFIGSRPNKARIIATAKLNLPAVEGRSNE